MRISRVVPPGHDNNSAVDTRYGNWTTRTGPGRSYVTVDDEKGVATTRVYDPYGRMRHVIADSAGTSAGTRNNRTSYAYDALDRLISTTMPGGGTTRYAYDTLGRMTSRHHPDAEGATLYKYDDLGRLRFSQDARQRAAGVSNATRKVTYTVYDDFGRVTRVGEAAADFSELDPERSYAFENDASSWRSRMTYDGGDAVADSDPVAGNGAASGGPNYAQGRLTTAQENTDADAAAEVVHRYAYDHLGNVRVKQVEIEGLTGAKTLEYVYDLAGRITGIIYPDGAQARYAYDGAGRLSHVGDARGMTLAEYTHTAAGNIGTHVVGDDVATGTYAYNPREWVTEINYAGTFNSKLTYDLAGNVTRQEYSHGTTASKTADYAYDDLYRITGFDLTGGTSRDYAYDRSGNLTSLVTGSSRLNYNYSAGSTPNRLDSTTGTAGQTYTYNQNGSVTSVGGNALSYDYRSLVTGYGGSNTYTRDSEGHRVKKTGPGGATYYLRGAGGAVLAEYNSGGTLTSSYFYAGGDRLARLANGAMHYYLKDHLGSTRTLLSSSGNAAATYDYWPYGEVLATGGTDATPFKFTGHERDAESGLDFMQYRTYEPNRMRFLQMDPRAEKYPGLSPYVYAGNNPLRFVDARGDTLDVGGLYKGKTALSYIHSMFDEETAKRITMGAGGRVSFDTEGLNLSQDSALRLLANLVNGSDNYLFEVANNTSAIRRVTAKDSEGKTLHAGESVEVNLLKVFGGIRVYSRTPRNVDGGTGSSGFLPKPGNDGQVSIAPGYRTLKGGLTMVPIGDTTFHELSEVYHRTAGGMPYAREDGSGAHDRAHKDAERHRNQGVSPSELRKGINYSTTPPTP